MNKANSAMHQLQACPQWLEKLNALHRDDLPFEERVELRAHLETCENCRAVRADYRAMDALITGLPQVAPLPAMPARLRELTGVRVEVASPREWSGTYETAAGPHSRVSEAAASYLLADHTQEAARPAQSSVPQAPPRTRTRTRSRLIGWNMAAAALVVAALIAGFLALRVTRPTSVANPMRVNHPHGPLQHKSYLDVIIGNGHGDSYAIDPQTGAVVWKHQVMTEPANNPFAANGILYYTGVNNVLYAIDGGDGQPLWHFQLAAGIKNAQAGWDLAASDDLVFATASAYTNNSAVSNSVLYALDAYTGRIVWQKKSPAASWWILTAANGVLYVDNAGLYALNAQDGHVLWYNPQVPASPVDSLVPASSVIITQGKIYLIPALGISTDRLWKNNRVQVVEASTGHLLKTLTINASDPQPFGLAASADTLYVAMNDGKGSPTLQAYSLADEHLLWQKTYSGRIISLSATGGQVYLGVMAASKAHPETKNPADYAETLIALKSDGGEAWRWHDTVGLAAMVAAVEINGVVCVVDGGVVGIQASTGQRLWQTSFSQPTGFPPAVD